MAKLNKVFPRLPGSLQPASFSRRLTGPTVTTYTVVLQPAPTRTPNHLKFGSGSSQTPAHSLLPHSKPKEPATARLPHQSQPPSHHRTSNTETSCACAIQTSFPSVMAQPQSPRSRTALKRGGHCPLPRVPAFAPPLSFPHQDGGVRPDYEDRALLGPTPGLPTAGVPLCQGGTRVP